MNTQHLVLEVGQGRKRKAHTVEAPSDDVLIAASLELRKLGEGKYPSAGRYGKCIGIY